MEMENPMHGPHPSNVAAFGNTFKYLLCKSIRNLFFLTFDVVIAAFSSKLGIDQILRISI